MRYEMHLSAEPFRQIVNDSKKIEVRLNDSKRKLLNVGDEILFISNENEEKTVLRKISALRHYSSFAEMAVNENCVLCGFDKDYNTQNVVDAYRKYYSETDEKTFGILIIELVK